jgi:hypothetical protein
MSPTTAKFGSRIAAVMKPILLPALLISYSIVGHSGLAQTRPPQSAHEQRPVTQLPTESNGWDAVIKGLLTTFDSADILALGEAHGRKLDSELRLRLLRDPDFPNKARVIVVEFANSAYQAVLDRYIQGDDIPLTDASRAWQDPAQRPVFPTIPEFFQTVREINRALPVDKRLRVFAGHPPDVGSRNDHAISVLREGVVSKHGKALVIYGSGHLWHGAGDGGITKALEENIPGRVFVAEVLAPVGRTGPERDELDKSLQALESTLHSTDRPVLALLKKGSAAGKLIANPFYLGEAMLPPNVTLSDLDDACIYFGRTPELGASLR